MTHQHPQYELDQPETVTLDGVTVLFRWDARWTRRVDVSTCQTAEGVRRPLVVVYEDVSIATLAPQPEWTVRVEPADPEHIGADLREVFGSDLGRLVGVTRPYSHPQEQWEAWVDEMIAGELAARSDSALDTGRLERLSEMMTDAAYDEDQVRAARDAEVLRLSGAGMTAYRIAQVTGLSQVGVAKIIRRTGR